MTMKLPKLRLVALVAICLTPCVGCTSLWPKPDPAAASRSEWFEDFKALKGTGAYSGMSSQAREIENSLGGR